MFSDSSGSYMLNSTINRFKPTESLSSATKQTCRILFLLSVLQQYGSNVKKKKLTFLIKRRYHKKRQLEVSSIEGTLGTSKVSASFVLSPLLFVLLKIRPSLVTMLDRTEARHTPRHNRGLCWQPLRREAIQQYHRGCTMN